MDGQRDFQVTMQHLKEYLADKRCVSNFDLVYYELITVDLNAWKDLRERYG